MFRPLVDAVADIIFPRNCILCRQYIEDKSSPQLCNRCYAAIEFNAPPFCLRCSRHLEIFTPQGLCPTCLRYPIVFDNAWGAVNYTPVVQNLLHHFKYGQKTAVRHIFDDLLTVFLNQYNVRLDAFDCLMPIPLHPVRLRERGFNQAELIAQRLHAQTGLPVAPALKRVRSTNVQALLGQKERWTNLQGAFTISHHFDVRHKSVLLVDDLLTTGATASSAALTLKEAGADQVGLMVVALAP